MRVRKTIIRRRLVMSLMFAGVCAVLCAHRAAACAIVIREKQATCCEEKVFKCYYSLELDMCDEARKVEEERPQDFTNVWSFLLPSSDPEIYFKSTTLLTAIVGLQDGAKADIYTATVKCKVTYDGSICEPTVPIEFTIIKVESITPDCENVGVESTIGLTAVVMPNGRTVTWSIEGDDHGCTVTSTDDLTADFTAGDEDAVVTVKACDSVLDNCCVTVNLTIVGACGDNEAISVSYEEGDEATVPEDAFGIWTLDEPPEVEFTVCYSDDFGYWIPRIESVTLVYHFGLAETPTPIDDVTDVTTEEDYCTIMAEFEPYIEDTKTYAGYDTFYSRKCVKEQLEAFQVNFEWEFSDVWSDVEQEIEEEYGTPFACNERDTVEEGKADLETSVADKAQETLQLAWDAFCEAMDISPAAYDVLLIYELFEAEMDCLDQFLLDLEDYVEVTYPDWECE